ncbi:hypothetical protein [Capnocytophaga ochracea]|nr:hypothetical protein [Capnocytophaga ochracea]
MTLIAGIACKKRYSSGCNGYQDTPASDYSELNIQVGSITITK